MRTLNYAGCQSYDINAACEVQADIAYESMIGGGRGRGGFPMLLAGASLLRMMVKKGE